MAILNSYATVVNGDQLNQGYFNDSFGLSINRVTRSKTNSTASGNTNTSYSNILSLATPVSLRAGQRVFVEAQVRVTNSSAECSVQLYDATAAAEIDIITTSASGPFEFYLFGEVTIASVGASKTIELRARRNSGTSYGASPAIVKCWLAE